MLLGGMEGKEGIEHNGIKPLTFTYPCQRKWRAGQIPNVVLEACATTGRMG
jgi:hypothetical protein